MIRAELADGRVLEFPENTDPSIIQATVKKMLQEQPVEQPEQQPTEQPIITENLLSIGSDVAANLIGGAVALPVSGIAGLAATNPLASEGAGARTQEAVQEALTPKLRTKGGQALMNALGKGIQGALGTEIPKLETGFRGLENFGKAPVEEKPVTLGEALDAPSEAAFESGGAGAATFVKTLPTALLELIPAFKVGKAAFNRALMKNKKVSVPDESLPEFSDAIKEQGIKPEDVLDKDQMDTLKRFSELDTAPTRGELGKDFKQLKEENALLTSASDPSGEKFREIKLEQSSKIRESVNKQVDALGIPENTGNSIKEALSARKSQLKATRKAAYEGFKEASKGTDIPLITSNLLDGLPDAGDIKTIKSLKPSESKAFDDLLQEFGVIEGGADVTPLTMQNFEGFRRRLGAIEQADQTGQIGVLINPIRKALDEEIELAFKSVEGGKNPNLSILAKEARQSHANLKTEFDEKSLTNQLISNKKRSSQAVIENSQVYNSITAKAVPVEKVQRLVDSLEAQGAIGQKALGDLQSGMLLDLIDSAYGASSRKIQGVRTFGGAAFQKRYQVLEPKLNVIFKNNPKALEQIKNLSKVAEDLTPPHGVVPQGSASFLIDIAQNVGLMKLAAMPGASQVVGLLQSLGQRAKNPIALKKAMKLKPELKKQVNNIKNDYPSLAMALGFGAIVEDSE